MNHRYDQSAPHRAGRLLLLAAVGLVLAPHLWRLPLWLAAFGVAIYAWRLLSDLKGWPLPKKWLRIALALLGFSAVLGHFRGVAGLDPGVALFTVMLCLKLLELNSLRDALVTVFLGFFLVIAGFLYDQSIPTGIYLFAVVLLLITALVALNHTQASLGRTRHYLRFAGTLLLQSLPLMLVLFLLFPRIPGPLWGIPDEPRRGLTGLDDTLFMGAINELADDDSVAFRVRFDGEAPAPSQLYWRGPVLWHTDGQTWTPLKEWQSHALPTAGYEAEGPAIDYTVTMEPHGRHWLFALDLPASLPDGIPGGVSVSADYQLVTRRHQNELRRYRIRSHLQYDTGLLHEREWTWGTRLPDDANPRSRSLAQSWVDEDLSDRQLVERALSYFREQPFYYTRTPDILENDPVDGFLFSSRRGFCEHYAASFVSLMRAAGLPARIVTGYQGGVVNPHDGYLVVRQSDAHAWAEVWLQEAGWVRVDPTAVIPPERVESRLDSLRFLSTSDRLRSDAFHWAARGWYQLRQHLDALDNAWQQWVLGFDSERQQRLFDNLGLGNYGRLAIIGLMFALLAVIVLVTTLYILRSQPQTSDPLQRHWLKFCRKLTQQGLERRLDEGPLNYAGRVANSRPDLAAEVFRIARLYTRLRYAGSDSADNFAELRRRITSFRPGTQR